MSVLYPKKIQTGTRGKAQKSSEEAFDFRSGWHVTRLTRVVSTTPEACSEHCRLPHSWWMRFFFQYGEDSGKDSCLVEKARWSKVWSFTITPFPAVFPCITVFSKGTDFSKLRIQLPCTPWIDAPKRNYSDANSMGEKSVALFYFNEIPKSPTWGISPLPPH